MSKKSSVYFGPPLEALTSSLSNEDSVSGRINRAAERYLEIVKHHDLKLTEEERLILGNCLSGPWPRFAHERRREVGPHLIRRLADEVADSEYSDSHLGKALIEKLRNASFADLVAEVERLGY